jgi:hypothetical protein
VVSARKIQLGCGSERGATVTWVMCVSGGGSACPFNAFCFSPFFINNVQLVTHSFV